MHASKILLVSASNGDVLWCALDWGSSADAGIFRWTNFADTLNKYDADLYIAGDSAFPACCHLHRVVREDEIDSMPIEYVPEAHALNSIFKTVRTAAEWSIKSLTVAFRVLQRRLPSDNRDFCKSLVETIVRLCNVRNRLMHVGQIGNVYGHYELSLPIA